MRREPKQVPSQVPTPAERGVQRLVVLELLSQDHAGPWSGCELSDELAPVNAEALATAIDSLAQVGVLDQDDDALSPSRALLRLDQLQLICI